MSQDVVRGVVCPNCDKRVAGFTLAGRARCIWCFLRSWPVMKRSLLTAAVVGTLLTAINQGNILADGDFPGELYWKIPLTYCVPFLVTTWGGLINSRIRHA